MSILHRPWGELEGLYTQKTDYLHEAYKDLRKRIEKLEAQSAGQNRVAISEPAKVPSSVAEGHAKPNLDVYKKWGKRDQISKLKEHCRILNGEPSEEACEHVLELFESGALDKKKLSKKLNCTEEKALAWTYILQKRGWVVWDHDLKGYKIFE